MELKSLDDVYYADVDEVNGLPGRFDYVPEPERDPLATGDLGVDTTTDASFADMITGAGQVVGEVAGRGPLIATSGLGGDIPALITGIVEAIDSPEGVSALDAFIKGMEEPTTLPTSKEMAEKIPTVMEPGKPQEMMQTIGEFGGVGGLALKTAKWLRGLSKSDEVMTPLQYGDRFEFDTSMIPSDKSKAEIDDALDMYQGGLISGDEVAQKIFSARESSKDIAKQRKWVADMTDRRRGEEYVKGRLNLAMDNKTLSKEAGKVTEWLINKNPKIADDLGIAIRTRTDAEVNRGVAGLYDRSERLVTLFKDKNGSQEAVHEVMHHTEQMLPPSVRENIRKIWEKAVRSEIKKGGKQDVVRDEMLLKMLAQNNGMGDYSAEINKAFDAEILTQADYRLTNPSEFWAEHAAEIINGKYGAKGKWIEEAKIYLKQLFEQLKDTVGISNTAAIYKGVNRVLKGERIQEGGRIADVQGLKDVMSDPNLKGGKGLPKVQEEIFPRKNK